MATQNFGGLLFGQGGTGLEDYLTPDQLQAIQQQGMLSASAALLSASGKRPVGQEISIGQALGGALQAGQQGYTQAQTGAINTLMAKEKLREAKMNADWAAGGGVIPTAALPVGGAAPVGTAGGLPAPASVPAGGAPTPQGMVNIGGFNVTPAQAQLLRQMPRKEALGEIFKMTNNQYTPMTSEEAAQAGLQPNAVYYKSPQGKPEVIYRPDYETITKPDGEMIWVDKNDPFGRSVPPSKVKSDVSSGKATVNQPAPTGDTRTPSPAGGAPVYAGGFAPALKPEQVMTTVQSWDKDYRQPVESILSAYNITKDLVQTGQGGISDYGVLIKAIKALDPNSAVMQGEADSARQMQGIADRMQGYLDKIEKGGVGSQQARLDLLNLARSSANVAIDAYNRQATRKAQLVGQYVPKAVINSTFQPYVKPSDLTSKVQMEKEVKANTVAPVAGQTLTYDPATKTWGYR
jgi:hypothetical protein